MALFKSALWESNSTAEDLCSSLISKKDGRKTEKEKRKKKILKKKINNSTKNIETKNNDVFESEIKTKHFIEKSDKKYKFNKEATAKKLNNGRSNKIKNEIEKIWEISRENLSVVTKKRKKKIKNKIKSETEEIVKVNSLTEDIEHSKKKKHTKKKKSKNNEKGTLISTELEENSSIKKLKKRNKNKEKINNTEVINLPKELKNKEVSLKLKKKIKHLEQLKHSLITPRTVIPTQNKNKPILTLRQKMMQKLKAARFRYLNEQIYKTTSKEAQKIFKIDPEAFEAYHEGYRLQVRRWPFNPLDKIIKSIKKMPKTHIVADFGCGEARLAKSLEQKVHSFDLVASCDLVTACDMSHVPLENNTVDVVVFCLSLMGTNLNEYLLEANRVLKVGGLLKIAEVESRFENVEEFLKNVTSFGFKMTWKDLSQNLFYFIDFKKEHNIKKLNKLPSLSLLPCLYKKR